MEKRNEIFNELETILKEQCECKEPIHMHSVIQEDLQLDSLSLMTFVTILEDKYDICLDELEEAPETLAELTQEIAKRQ